MDFPFVDITNYREISRRDKKYLDLLTKPSRPILDPQCKVVIADKFRNKLLQLRNFIESDTECVISLQLTNHNTGEVIDFNNFNDEVIISDDKYTKLSGKYSSRIHVQYTIQNLIVEDYISEGLVVKRSGKSHLWQCPGCKTYGKIHADAGYKSILSNEIIFDEWAYIITNCCNCNKPCPVDLWRSIWTHLRITNAGEILIDNTKKIFSNDIENTISDDDTENICNDDREIEEVGYISSSRHLPAKPLI